MMESVDGETSEEEEECQDATNEEKCWHRDKSKRKCQDAVDEEECICKETNKWRGEKKYKQKHKQKTSGKRVEGRGTSQKHCRCHLDSSYATFLLVTLV